MDEPAACLLRSFSHPSDASREVREGDPIRALTESVSFGRFMSESLAWEKWSAFSHNRYMEEVERFAKPGTVAQKKAYFEAHYRKKAALREASVNVEEPSSGVEVEQPALEIELEPMQQENHVSCIELQEENSLDNISVGSAEVPIRESVSDNVEVASSGTIEQVPAIKAIAQKEDSTEMCDSDQCAVIRSSSDKILHEEAAHAKTSIPTAVKDRDTSSSKSLDASKPTKRLIPHAKGILTTGKRKEKASVSNMEKEVTEKSKSAKKSIHMSINFPSSISTVVKDRDTSSSMSLDASKPTKRLLPRAKGISTTGKRKEKASVLNMEKEVAEKSKSAKKSIHMSINFPSSTISTSKPLSPVLRQIKKLKDATASLKLQRDSSMSRKPPIQASVNVTSKFTSAPKPEDSRANTLLSKSVAGRLMTDKDSNFRKKEILKLSSANGSNVQAPVVFSPFRFRSEERAAKRKEKQEGKINNAKGAENVKPHQRHLFPNTCPQLPNLRKKAVSGTITETKPRPPRQTAMKSDAANFTKGKSNPGMRGSAQSFASRRNVHENSSPNILR